MAVQLSVDIPRGPEGPQVARGMLRERFARELPPAELADVEIIVSELVTNALVHGEGSVRLRLTVDDGVITGEVIDEGTGFEADVRERGVRDIGGRGLLLVGTVADRWGIHDGSSHVWFELERRTPSGDAPAPPELGEHQRPDELE